MQLAPQRCWPAAQPLEHAPARTSHTGMAPEQARPHIPQLVAVFTIVSQPLDAIESQSPKPITHEPTAHAPATQAAIALLTEHALLQRPQ